MLLDYVPAFAVSTVAMIVDFNGNDGWLDVLLPNVMDDSFRSGVFLVVIYYVILLSSIQLFGQTLGKYLLGLRVVDESGTPATARQKMKYELLAPFSLDSAYRYQTFQWGYRRRIWADRWAGTGDLQAAGSWPRGGAFARMLVWQGRK
jgi:uncharacterized RDD family membrane protein YckC